MSRLIKFITAAAVACSALAPFHAVAEIPIDAPRGNYEGADNIHWYNQTPLRRDLVEQLLPSATSPFRCNSENIYQACDRMTPLRDPAELYGVAGTPIFDMVVYVDNRQTPNFNNGWRRATREIRQINNALERSGVNLRVVVSHIENVDLSGFSTVSDVWNKYANTEETRELMRRHRSDGLWIVANSEAMGIDGVCGVGSLGLAQYWTPVAVTLCSDDYYYRTNSMVAPHEFGHFMGCTHDSSEDFSFVPFAHGYRDASGYHSIMAYRQETNDVEVEVFSSPFAYLSRPDVVLGSESGGDCAKAMRMVGATAALYYEREFGIFSSQGAFGALNGQQDPTSETLREIPPPLMPIFD
ncbi:hypothetical protein A3709_20830 [Halioglobus sp. HI00S01]|uniref:M12 family metallo-peptidase n=1 Tax=Halioglobus sp. HI00S01 TaxID=1822214 RepID=UPI0007C302D9|nr:M12 family metallo-peptidase [Halioglobus sp. HI00S01]KZX58060.1 hypothetical protein A3709_20830 [Halioglobus sp. HI00S01]